MASSTIDALQFERLAIKCTTCSTLPKVQVSFEGHNWTIHSEWQGKVAVRTDTRSTGQTGVHQTNGFGDTYKVSIESMPLLHLRDLYWSRDTAGPKLNGSVEPSAQLIPPLYSCDAPMHG